MPAPTLPCRRMPDAFPTARNQLSRQGLPPDEMRELGRELKQTAARLDAEVAACRARLEEEGLKLPVLSHEGTPVGDESAAIALRTIGDMPQFDFEPKGHLEIGAWRAVVAVGGWMGARASGCRGYEKR